MLLKTRVSIAYSDEFLYGSYKLHVSVADFFFFFSTVTLMLIATGHSLSFCITYSIVQTILNYCLDKMSGRRNVTSIGEPVQGETVKGEM